MTIILANRCFQALSTIGWRRAARMIAAGAPTYGDIVRLVATPGDVFEIRQIVVNATPHIPHIPPAPPERVSHATILQRDEATCAYCGAPATTIDHIIPSSRGGANTWDNLVCACLACNNRKGDKTPLEAGMELLFEPFPPRSRAEILQDEANQILARLPL